MYCIRAHSQGPLFGVCPVICVLLLLSFVVGEPINHEAWDWFYNVVGDGRCPLVDTWWQTGEDLCSLTISRWLLSLLVLLFITGTFEWVGVSLIVEFSRIPRKAWVFPLKSVAPSHHWLTKRHKKTQAVVSTKSRWYLLLSSQTNDSWIHNQHKHMMLGGKEDNTRGSECGWSRRKRAISSPYFICCGAFRVVLTPPIKYVWYCLSVAWL